MNKAAMASRKGLEMKESVESGSELERCNLKSEVEGSSLTSLPIW